MTRTWSSALSSLLIVSLLGLFGAAGCGSSIQTHQRPDIAESLVANSHWHRVPEAESDQALYTLQHGEHRVAARLHRLDSYYLIDALPLWGLAWADDQFGPLELLDVPEPTTPSLDTRRISFTARADVEAPNPARGFDIYFFNAGDRSYYLEFFGESAALGKLPPSARELLLTGFRASANSPDAPGPQAWQAALETSTTVGEALGVALDLPGKLAPATISGKGWTVDEGEEQLSASLDGRLITALVWHEPLPYDVGVTRYVELALAQAEEDEAVRVGEPVTLDDGRMEVTVIDARGVVEMTRVYQFATHELTAYQVIISTPTALLEQNDLILTPMRQSFRILR